MNINQNDVAFPFIESSDPTENVNTGLTIRAELAARMYSALLSTTTVRLTFDSSRILAEESIMCTDALIEQLNKKV